MIRLRHIVYTFLLSGILFSTEICYATSSFFALQEDDSLLAAAAYKKASQFMDSGLVDKARQEAEKILFIGEDARNPELLAATCTLLARIAGIQENSTDYLYYLLRALSAYEKLGINEKAAEISELTGDYYYRKSVFDKALEYYQRALSLRRNLPADRSVFSLREKTGSCYLRSNQISEAKSAMIPLLNDYRKAADSTSVLRVLAQLSSLAVTEKNFTDAIGYDRQMLSICSAQHDSSAMVVVLNNMAYNYVLNQKYTEASGLFRQSLQLATKYRKEEVPAIVTNLAVCYQNMRNYSTAITLLNQAMEIPSVRKNPGAKALLENMLATTYFYKNDLYNAGEISRRSIESAAEANDMDLLQKCYFTYSQILKSGNDYIAALDYYEKHLALKDSLDLHAQVNRQKEEQFLLEADRTDKDLWLRISNEDRQDLELRQMRLEAEKRQKELDLLKKERELETSEKQRILQAMVLNQQRHEAELREREMKNLQQEKAIQDLRLQQQEADRKRQEQEIKLLQVEKEKQALAKKRAIGMTILSAIIAISILVGLIVMRRKNITLAWQKKQIEEKNEELEQMNQEILAQTDQIVKQKQIIEEKNKAITDSILYARHIQKAVLPSEEEIIRFFSEGFVLFLPRDIVSGDFFWGIRRGHSVVVAAADCTGHGVPGAFMSMMGLTFLYDIVGAMPELDAAEILNQLRANVIRALHHKGKTEETRDGMDISLCIINPLNNTLQYAGANNPIYIIRNGNLTILKPDKMPIGMHFDNTIPFTNHTVEIGENDRVYMFSDGYADQFGGPNNKKFKYASLQKLLLQIHALPMQEQSGILLDTFNNWKGDNAQIDDILMIGFRI